MRNYKYLAYLQSKKWKMLKRKILKRDKHKCRRCGSKESLQIHHKTYKRVYREWKRDLITLCKSCHEREHGIISKKEKAITRVYDFIMPWIYIIFVGSLSIYKLIN